MAIVDYFFATLFTHMPIWQGNRLEEKLPPRLNTGLTITYKPFDLITGLLGGVLFCWAISPKDRHPSRLGIARGI